MEWMFGGIIAFIAALYVILNVTKTNSPNKLVWVVCAVLFSVVTAVVYFFAGPKPGHA